MPEQIPPPGNPRTPVWPLVVIGLSGVLLVLWLKVPGLILALLLAAAVYLVRQRRDLDPEIASLITSIRLVAESITDVQDSWDTFREGTDAEALADRTLTRPALADPDCGDPEIERFHFEMNNAGRFLNRLEARLQAPLSVNQLETLLRVTEERALAIEESWLSARKAARRLGPDYGREDRRRD